MSEKSGKFKGIPGLRAGTMEIEGKEYFGYAETCTFTYRDEKGNKHKADIEDSPCCGLSEFIEEMDNEKSIVEDPDVDETS